MGGLEEDLHERVAGRRIEGGLEVSEAEQDGEEHAEPQKAVQRDAGKQRVGYYSRSVLNLFGHLSITSIDCGSMSKGETNVDSSVGTCCNVRQRLLFQLTNRMEVSPRNANTLPIMPTQKDNP